MITDQEIYNHRNANHETSQISRFPEHRLDIDGLRGIAVLSVVGFHAFPYWFGGGYVGVDVFFVISGFLISTILFRGFANNSFSFFDFYSRRVRRIFPALLLVLISVFVLGWFALTAGEYKQLGKHIAGASGFVNNFVVWGEDSYFNNAAGTKPLLHLWSLGIEEQFYLFWPPIIWLSWKSRANPFANPLTIAITIAVISFILNVRTVSTDTVAAFFSPQTRFWELLAGSVLSYLGLFKYDLLAKLQNARFGKAVGSKIFVQALRIADYPFRDAQSLLGVILIAIGVFALSDRSIFPGWLAILPTAGTVLIISAGNQAWLNRTLLSNKVLVWFGVISYPLYLWHWPLLSFEFILEGAPPLLGLASATVVISIALAWLTYVAVERPIRFGSAPFRNARTITLIVSMAVVGFVGYNCFERDGLTFRKAEQIVHMNSFDRHYYQSCAFIPELSTETGCNAGTAANSSAGIVVVGDSIANAYSTMFNAYSLANKNVSPFIQIGTRGCPTLIDYGTQECRKITGVAFDYIKTHPFVKTVVVAGQWSQYYPGTEYRKENRIETADSFKIAFEKTIQEYKSTGKQVVVLLAPPVADFNVSLCLNRRIRLSGGNQCNIPRDKANASEKNYRDFIIPYLKSQNIPYFDPFQYFCGDKVCALIDGDKVLLADSMHISIFGGEFLAAKGRVRLDELFANSHYDTPGSD